MPPRKRPPGESGGFAITAASPGPASYLQTFLNYLEAECGLARNTVIAYRSDLQKFFEWHRSKGSPPLAKIDLKLLTAYLDHLHGRDLAASSIGRHLVAIKMFFRYLVLEGVLLENKLDLLSSPKLWQHLPKVLSPDVIDRLLQAPCPDDRLYLRDRALLAMLYATGCRASEISAMRLSDVHLRENYCRCVGKGNKERMASLNPVARLAIENWLQHERPQIAPTSHASDWLFVTRTGKQLTRNMIWTLVKKYAARVGCSKDVSPHTLRHSFATHMLAGGADIRALQEMLGHASVATTQIYTHVEHSRLKAVHQRCHPRG